MHYLVDGYNLLFRLTVPGTLQEKREACIAWLIDYAKEGTASVTLFFDSRVTPTEELERGHKGDLEIVYTGPGQTADEAILEWITTASHKANCCAVTSDNGLVRRCRSLGAQVKSCEAFSTFLEKRKSKRKAPSEKRILLGHLCHEYSRWLKAFEERLK